MLSNKEIRAEAWRLMWTKLNFLKLTGMMIFHFIAVGLVVGAVVAVLYRSLESGETVNPFGEFAGRILVGIIQSVASLGLTAMVLALAKAEETPYKESFLGYAYPFRSFFAMLAINFTFLLWGLPIIALACLMLALALPLLLVPIYLAWVMMIFYLIYRYRFFWFVKAESPKMGAFEALRESVKLSNGEKWKLFKFDLSYWLSALWILVPIVGGFIFLWHFALGTAIFYRELRRENMI